MADYKNHKVKKLNQQYQVVSHWEVTANIYDMCLITPSEVAVVVNENANNTHEVQFIKVTKSQLTPGRKLKLQHECSGIAHHQGELFITSGTAVFKYTLTGKLVCRLYEDRSADYTCKNHCEFILITFLLCTGIFLAIVGKGV
ncbi:hypothetical protein DPMN_143875 [Dreissena polymorpha]|uniref:Uncharacterized protein n=1 Tax=Dreissena polymorpha TaxID=45954 RepID=A0A9D4GH80_DREPO|nr:hypothetical protein DPMN_143875 [Dreissena polymorpha]